MKAESGREKEEEEGKCNLCLAVVSKEEIHQLMFNEATLHTPLLLFIVATLCCSISTKTILPSLGFIFTFHPSSPSQPSAALGVHFSVRLVCFIVSRQNQRRGLRRVSSKYSNHKQQIINRKWNLELLLAAPLSQGVTTDSGEAEELSFRMEKNSANKEIIFLSPSMTQLSV